MSDIDRYLTDEVVEKAAEAEWEYEWPVRSWERASDDIRDQYISIARAALTAALPDAIRKAKAEAWDEGLVAGADMGIGVGERIVGTRSAWPDVQKNPYRREGES